MARLLGIDIQPLIVRAALVRTSYRRVAIEALSAAPVIDGDVGAAIAAVSGALKTDGVAVGLPGDLCYYRRLELPSTAQRELESVLSYEIESTVPFEMDEVVFDRMILKAGKGETSVAVFAALAKTADVVDRIELVKRVLGREPEVVAPGSMPLANLAILVPSLERGLELPRAVPFEPDPAVPGAPTPPPNMGAIALLDLAEARSELVVLAAGEPVFARTVSRGTQTLPEMAEQLGAELKQTLGAYRMQGTTPVAGLYLAGAGAGIANAESFLARVLGIPVARLPMPAIEGVRPDQVEALPLFAKAIALALSLEGRSRGLNLRQGELATSRSYPFLREKLPLLSGLAAVIAVSFGFSVVADMRSLSAEREMLDADLMVVTKEALGEETNDLARAQELLDKGPGAAEEEPMPGADAFDVMIQLSKAVPKELVHDVVEFDVNRNHVVVTATIPKEEDASTATEQIINGMKEQPCFKNVKVEKTTQFGQDKQKYVLELDIACDGDKKDPNAKKTTTPANTAAKEGGK